MTCADPRAAVKGASLEGQNPGGDGSIFFFFFSIAAYQTQALAEKAKNRKCAEARTTREKDKDCYWRGKEQKCPMVVCICVAAWEGRGGRPRN